MFLKLQYRKHSAGSELELRTCLSGELSDDTCWTDHVVLVSGIYMQFKQNLSVISLMTQVRTEIRHKRDVSVDFASL